MTSITLNFKEDVDFFFFVEMIFDSAITRIKNYKKLEADFESLRNAAPPPSRDATLRLENLQLKDKIKEFEAKISSVSKTKDKRPISSLDAAKHILKEEGYVFYKYEKPKTLKQRRHRRTRKEIVEEAGMAIRP